MMKNKEAVLLLRTKIGTKIGKAIVLCITTLIFLSGCATTSVIEKKGMDLFHRGSFDDAVILLDNAYKEKPSKELRLLLFRARMNSYYFHLARARSFKEVKKKKEALAEYALALAVFPDNKSLRDEFNDYKEGKKKKKKKFVSTIIAPVKLKIDAAEKMSLNLRSTPITKIFKVVGKSYGINFIFDKDFRDFVYSLDIEQIGFYDILNQLCMIGNAQYRVLDTSSVLIYPNTTFKKRTFGLKGVKVFYLSNVKAEDAKKLLLTLFRDQQIQAQEDTTLNSLIIKATYSTLREIERFLHSIDKRKSEVAIDIQILELTKTAINALGLNYGDVNSPISSLSATPVDADGIPITTTPNFKQLKNTNFFLTIPSASLTFLESDDRNKAIARPNLRGLNGEEIKFMVGDEVPVPQTQFQSFVPGGSNNTPVTTYQYKNVGVEVKVTPMIHRNNEVTLKIKLTTNSIAGSENGFPIFGKRELESVIRLKEGETNIVGGFIKDEVRRAASGLPWLSRLPILGKLFGASGKNVKQTDLVFSITPRVIQSVEIDETDQQTIWNQAEQVSAGGTSSPRGKEPDRPGRPSQNRGTNSVIISPAKRRAPINAVSFFTIRLNSRAKLSSLAISGAVSGGKASIEEVKNDFFGKSKVEKFNNSSGTSFDLGYTFPAEGNVRVNVVAQLKIKFLEKGKFTINFSNLTASDKNRQPVELKGSTAEIEVY